MAAHIKPDAGADYQGLAGIFEFINSDGVHRRSNCGQAACATFLTHHRELPTDAIQAARLMDEIEARFPADILKGLFGTSRRRVVQTCRAFGLRVQPIEGEEALRAQLTKNNPVIVMLAVSAGRFLRWDLPGGHWMVAYGLDADGVYLTNYGKMGWPDFRAGWNGLSPRLISMRRRGLAILPRAA